MNITKVTILGGAGFVGGYLARVLAQRGVAVTVPTRNRERAKRELIVLPTVDVVQAGFATDAELDRLIEQTDAVVNLVGILHEARRGDFQRVHAELPARIAAACARTGVKRLVHMSALCAGPEAPSAYLRSKGEGEARVLAAAGSALAVTVFRPSVIFGLGDSFLTLFARMLGLAPVVLLGSPTARFQPVWVEDVVRAIADALPDPMTFGQRYELCGPAIYTLRELMALTGKACGHERPIIGLSDGLSYLQALVMELSPVKILTRDNLRSMSVDNVCGCGWPSAFRFAPSALEAVLPTYLGSDSTSYDGFRARAGR